MAFVLGTLTGLWLSGPVVAAPAAVPATLERDFDGDGVAERIVSRLGSDEIQMRKSATAPWEKADFALPEGVSRLDAAGGDAGLRFVDLNRDGFDDVLFGNGQRFGIHLWTKSVQPHLGWTKGWSQFVRSGSPTGAANEPPSLVGAEVRGEGDDLVIVHPASGGVPARTERRRLKDLVAFDMSPPKSPAEALASMRVRPGFRVELVAAEPVVIDPVGLDWGPDGRFWVVEMRDYPQGIDGKGKPGGVVKVLVDADGDGQYEKAVPFLEEVPFPSSLMTWGKGVLIATAPDVIYAEDTDGDGRADVRRVLLTGFNPGNQQHRVNGFEWGLDGWVYAANGDSGGKVQAAGSGRTLSISGRDIRFHPETDEFETVSAQTQYGRRRDDWGNWFGNNNPTWLWHVTMPEHYLRRNPKVAVRRVSQVLANYEDSTRVYPASTSMVRPNQPWSLNHVTSACSPTPYRDDLFGVEFASSVFISEPVHNAVHREMLERDGSGFRSRRAPGEERTEFLASTDNWFRPTTTRTGPDGALYVADMYRFVIEHPEWISPEMQARLDVRAGSDRGRIYRVVPEGRPRRGLPDLTRLGGPELARALDSPNGWQRDQVQRMLAARPGVDVVPELERLLSPSRAPQVRLQALATLGLLKALTPASVIAALADPNAWVRCEALRQSEVFAGRAPEIFSAVSATTIDGDAAVRLQAAFSLGAWPPNRAEPFLADLAARADSDEVTRTAVLSSLRPDSALFAKLNRKDAPARSAAVAVVAAKPSSPDRAAVIAGYAGLSQRVGDAVHGKKLYQDLCVPCHRLRGEGHEVGPDLAMVGSKPLDWLLAAILDPGQAVEARFRAWSIRLKSGDILDGLVSTETVNNLVVRMAGGVEQAVLRSDIAAVEPLKTSLMPGGFETALKLSDMADLVAWLQGK